MFRSRGPAAGSLAAAVADRGGEGGEAFEGGGLEVGQVEACTGAQSRDLLGREAADHFGGREPGFEQGGVGFGMKLGAERGAEAEGLNGRARRGGEQRGPAG